MIFALMVVLGLLIGVMYLMKNFMQRAVPSADHASLINVLSSRYLGPKNSIVLVEVLEQIIVVGISDRRMTALAQIDDPEAVARVKSQKNNRPTALAPGHKIARLMSLVNLAGAGKKDRLAK